MRSEKQPRWQSGDPILATQLNTQSEGIERADNLTVGQGSQLELISTSSGKVLRDRNQRDLWVKITGGGTAGRYSGTQQLETSSGGWEDGTRTFDSSTFPLIEVASATGVPVNTIVRAFKARYFWRFAYSACGNTPTTVGALQLTMVQDNTPRVPPPLPTFFDPFAAAPDPNASSGWFVDTGPSPSP